jgi:argininosuccinate lyase
LFSCVNYANFFSEQEDKEPLFDSVKAILGMLEVCSEFAQNISFNSKRIQSSLPAGYLDATTLADYLVKKVNTLSSPWSKLPVV